MGSPDSTPNIPPVFRRQGEFFVPSEAAPGPWNPEHLHGGPSAGLLARALEREVDDESLHPARLTVDLFRPVPKRPLRVLSSLVRDGRRIKVGQASLFDGETEVARASGLFLLRTEMPGFDPGERPKLKGPEGLETTGLWRGARGAMGVRGFHTVIETRWPEQSEDTPMHIWFRLPCALVEGEETSTLCRVAAIGDFAAALASMAGRTRGSGGGPTFMNTDMTHYLSRRPRGQWLAMAYERNTIDDGIEIAEVSHYDIDGYYGHTVQARLMMAAPPSFRAGG
ncbi:MAG: thioesterase family protein [Myxococcales bacterium]|nr:thioesterase family protein [Myxococcales bacterium]